MEQKKTSSPNQAAEREPYEAPQIVYREPLEAVATVCGPPGGKGTPGACPLGPLSS